MVFYFQSQHMCFTFSKIHFNIGSCRFKRVSLLEGMVPYTLYIKKNGTKKGKKNRSDISKLNKITEKNESIPSRVAQLCGLQNVIIYGLNLKQGW